MGLNTFNATRSNLAGFTPFSLPKIQSNPYSTNTKFSNFQVYHQEFMSNWRTGQGNKAWRFSGAGATYDLDTINADGTTTSIAAGGVFSAVLSGAGAYPTFHHSSADQCIYFLLNGSSNLRQLGKISDTTGAWTSIGSAFTPTTLVNWHSGGGGLLAGNHMYLDTVSGHLKIIYNGVHHLINKTTGALVSQDTAITVGSYSTKGMNYFTQDGTTACDSVAAYGGGTQGAIVDLSLGLTGRTTFSPSYYGQYGASTLCIAGTLDSDKLVIGFPQGTAGPSGTCIVLRSEYDTFVKSVMNYLKG